MKKFAIYFPQFHEVQANNAAWGSGFTDWSLVACANAFDYWNRRAPACGFYDLSIPSVVEKRFDEAASAGLDGFGIYHYRFADGPELVAIENYLINGSIPKDFTYFFIWANENWTRRWAGKNTELLKFVIKNPSPTQVREHVEYLEPFMKSKSYTTIEGKPLFVVYRPEFFEDPSNTIRLYRDEFQRVGLGVSMGFFLKSSSDIQYSSLFDFCYLFEPRLYFNSGTRKKLLISIANRLIHFFPYSIMEAMSELLGKILYTQSRTHQFSDFLIYFNSTKRKKLVESILCSVQNVLTVGWNNAPRYRDRFIELQVPTRNEISAMLTSSITDEKLSNELPLLCNAWNEWSEGAALETCIYLGNVLQSAYLESTK